MAAELTVDRLRQRVARAMGWRRDQDWPSETEPVEIVNEAGEWLYSVHEWFFLCRPPATLTLVAEQGWIDLPSDFGRTECEEIPASVGGAACIRLGTLDEVRSARLTPAAGSPPYVACIVHTGPPLAGPRSLARLEIGPVPAAGASGTFELSYRAGWVEVTEGSDHVLVPSWMEALLVEAATAFVGGREHEEDGTLFDRLDRIVTSSLMLAATNRDSAIQTALGPIRGVVGETLGDYGGPIVNVATGIQILGSNT